MLYHFLKNRAFFALLGSVALLMSACTKEYVCPIPNIDLFELTVIVPTSEILTARQKPGGYKGHGIIVYHYYDGEVHAFDATCANSEECIEQGVAAFDGQGKVTATCKRCGAQYYLRDGKHQSKRVTLRPYNVQRIPNTTEQYRISNY